jgi:hypothetical protein
MDRRLSKRLREENKSESQSSSRRSGSPERRQQLASEHTRFILGGEQPGDRQTIANIQDETTHDAKQHRKGKHSVEEMSLYNEKTVMPSKDKVVLSMKYSKDNPGLAGGGNLPKEVTDFMDTKHEWLEKHRDDNVKELKGNIEILKYYLQDININVNSKMKLNIEIGWNREKIKEKLVGEGTSESNREPRSATGEQQPRQ